MQLSIGTALLTLNLLLLVTKGATNTPLEMEETSCTFLRNGSCYIQITLAIVEKNVSFTISYTNSTGDSHSVLDCAWRYAFHCLQGAGYSYTPPINETLHIYVDPSIRCVNGGTFRIVLDQDIKRRCKNEIDLSHQNGSKQDLPKCQISSNLTEQTPTTSSGVECSSTISLEADTTPSLSEDQTNTTGIAIGTVVGVIVLIVVIVIGWRYKRCLKKKDQDIKRNSKEVTDPSEVETCLQTSVPEAPQQNCSTQEVTCLNE